MSSFFKDPSPSPKLDFIHKTVSILQNLDQADERSNANNFSFSHLQPSTPNHSVSVPSTTYPGMMTTTLNECFELFTQTEELSDENSWKCSKCKQQTNAYKNLCISTAPPILIIHLKRFFYQSKTSNFKLTTPVWFPVSTLDISKYVACDNNSTDSTDNLTNGQHHSEFSNKSYTYDLFAVCNHKGQNMANGHYTAFCKNLVDTKWYCFDDSNCFPLVDNPSDHILNTGFNNVFTENAYILFYKRRYCMTNEHWWINHVDRALYNSPEFVEYYRDIAQIERQQQHSHNETQLSANQAKKPNSLRSSIKNRILGTGKSGAANLHSNSAEELAHEHTQRGDDREIIKEQEETGGGNLINLDEHQLSNSINYYDELNRPKRIQHHKQNTSNFSNASTSSSNTTTHSTPARPSFASNNANALHKMFSMDTANLAAKYANESDDLIHLDPVAHINNSLNRQLKLADANSSGQDLLLNYPSDNEFVYYHTKQQVMNSYNGYNNGNVNAYYQYNNRSGQIPQKNSHSSSNQRNYTTSAHSNGQTSLSSANYYNNQNMNGNAINSNLSNSNNTSNNNNNSNPKSRYINQSSIETNI